MKKTLLTLLALGMASSIMPFAFAQAPANGSNSQTTTKKAKKSKKAKKGSETKATK